MISHQVAGTNAYVTPESFKAPGLPTVAYLTGLQVPVPQPPGWPSAKAMVGVKVANIKKTNSKRIAFFTIISFLPGVRRDNVLSG
jgi:hypothetical protein